MADKTIKGKKAEAFTTKRLKKIERKTKKIQVETQRKRIIGKAKTKKI